VLAFSNILVNGFSTQLDLYPVSIFGFSIGGSITERAPGVSTFYGSDFACGSVQCSGSIYRTFLSARLGLGADRVFLMGSARVDFLSGSQNNQPFVEETNRILGQAGGDTAVTWDLNAGYQFDPKWSGLLLLTSTKMQGSGYSSNFFQALAFYTQDPIWTYALGAGTYSGTVDPMSLSMSLMVKWTGKHSIGLF
jgi:hypothetical protein